LKLVSDLNQWAKTIDLIKKLQVNLVLDVGANRGFYAKHLRASGYKGQIVSFEPIPREADSVRSLSKDDPDWSVEEYALEARPRPNNSTSMERPS